MNLGDRSRCIRCGHPIILVKHPRFISISIGMWAHESAIKRIVSRHAAIGPA